MTPLADDPAGRVLREHLDNESVEVVALPASRTSTVVVMLGPSGERTMLSDRVAFAGDPDSRARLHAGGNLDVQIPATALPAAATARRARTAVAVSGASARRARLVQLHRERLPRPVERLFEADLDPGLDVLPR